MKSLTSSSSCWSAVAKAGLALACVIGQMPAHATEEEEVVMVGPANNMNPVIVTNERVKSPHKHRRVVPAPAKPQTTPSKPQQPVLWLR
jgi:hypothetical protein